jgi:hypothetical protein
MIKRTIALALAAATIAGCGEGTPTSIDETTPLLTNVEYVTQTEFEGYITTVQSTMPNYNIMIAEFSSIAAQFNAGFVPLHFISAYTKNLLRRVEDIQAHAERIRPENPELLKLHLEEYEGALADFNVGFSLFVQSIDQPGSVDVNEINDRIVDGNTHLIRLQILLGDLGGTVVNFFSDQGDDGTFPDEDFDEFGF